MLIKLENNNSGERETRSEGFADCFSIRRIECRYESNRVQR